MHEFLCTEFSNVSDIHAPSCMISNVQAVTLYSDRLARCRVAGSSGFLSANMVIAKAVQENKTRFETNRFRGCVENIPSGALGFLNTK
jgi:hypothetical protein